LLVVVVHHGLMVTILTKRWKKNNQLLVFHLCAYPLI
jgi:hypothetical protein